MTALSPIVFAHQLVFSQYEGKAYDVVKSDLLAKGWKTQPKQNGENSINEQYPEITCGSGSMAICSVGFRNKQKSAAFVILRSGDQLIVSGEY